MKDKRLIIASYIYDYLINHPYINLRSISYVSRNVIYSYLLYYKEHTRRHPKQLDALIDILSSIQTKNSSDYYFDILKLVIEVMNVEQDMKIKRPTYRQTIIKPSSKPLKLKQIPQISNYIPSVYYIKSDYETMKSILRDILTTIIKNLKLILETRITNETINNITSKISLELTAISDKLSDVNIQNDRDYSLQEFIEGITHFLLSILLGILMLYTSVPDLKDEMKDNFRDLLEESMTSFDNIVINELKKFTDAIKRITLRQITFYPENEETIGKSLLTNIYFAIIITMIAGSQFMFNLNLSSTFPSQLKDKFNKSIAIFGDQTQSYDSRIDDSIKNYFRN